MSLPQTVIKEREMMAQRAAELRIEGKKYGQIIKILGDEFECTLNRRQVEHLRKHPVYEKTMLEAAEAQIKSGIAETKLGALSLVPEVIDALRKLVKKGNTAAIGHILKIIGIESEEPTKQAQAMTIIMPGAEMPKDISIDQKEESKN